MGHIFLKRAVGRINVTAVDLAIDGEDEADNVVRTVGSGLELADIIVYSVQQRLVFERELQARRRSCRRNLLADRHGEFLLRA